MTKFIYRLILNLLIILPASILRLYLIPMKEIRYIRVSGTHKTYFPFMLEPVSTDTNTGKFYVEYLIDCKLRYEYHYVLRYCKTRCIVFRMGHKLGLPPLVNIGKPVKRVFELSLFSSYTGTSLP